MSTSSSRTLPTEVLSHPEVVALVQQGRTSGHVTSDALRAATHAAGVTAGQLKSLMRMLSSEGVHVLVTAEESHGRKRVAAATSARSTVKATATKKAAATKKTAAKSTPAKSTPATSAATKAAPSKSAKTAAPRKSTAKKATEPAVAEVEVPVVGTIGADGKKILPDVPDEIFEADLKKDPTLKEEEKEASKGFVVSSSDESDDPEQ